MEPKIFLDYENDFVSIMIKPGTEAKSYEKDGFIFCENTSGEIIEIQILNLSVLAKERKRAS